MVIAMVSLLVGHKGSGKTKKMVDHANESLNNVNGSVVFINKNSRLTTDLKYSIRVVCMDDYEEIANTDQFVGFIYGVISQDHDIEVIYIDSILKYADISIDNLEDLLARINKISEDHNIKFVVSISADKEELGDYLNNYSIMN